MSLNTQFAIRHHFFTVASMLFSGFHLYVWVITMHGLEHMQYISLKQFRYACTGAL